MIRNLLQLQNLPQVRPFADNGHNAAVIGLEKDHQHQHGKQLRLREIVTGIPAGVGRKRLLGNFQGLPGQRHRRPGHGSCGIHQGSIEPAYSSALTRISTEPVHSCSFVANLRRHVSSSWSFVNFVSSCLRRAATPPRATSGQMSPRLARTIHPLLIIRTALRTAPSHLIIPP